MERHDNRIQADAYVPQYETSKADRIVLAHMEALRLQVQLWLYRLPGYESISTNGGAIEDKSRELGLFDEVAERVVTGREPELICDIEEEIDAKVARLMAKMRYLKIPYSQLLALIESSVFGIDLQTGESEHGIKCLSQETLQEILEIVVRNYFHTNTESVSIILASDLPSDIAKDQHISNLLELLSQKGLIALEKEEADQGIIYKLTLANEQHIVDVKFSLIYDERGNVIVRDLSHELPLPAEMRDYITAELSRAGLLNEKELGTNHLRELIKACLKAATNGIQERPGETRITNDTVVKPILDGIAATRLNNRVAQLERL